MMPFRPVFADACYWIALLHESEIQDALQDLASLLHDEVHDRPVVTSDKPADTDAAARRRPVVK